MGDNRTSMEDSELQPDAGGRLTARVARRMNRRMDRRMGRDPAKHRANNVAYRERHKERLERVEARRRVGRRSNCAPSTFVRSSGSR